MYITPNTTIRIVRNCPLDNSYQNTIFFKTPTEQNSFFFTGLNGYTFQNNTYQRVGKNKIRVQQNAERLYDCNYLCFQNASFVGKWFYAFITNIEYINNITSEITYELDLMQTWHFDYKVTPSFIEREHSITDEIGDNIVEEKLATGEYIMDNYSEPTMLDPDDYYVVLFCTIDYDYVDVGAYWNDYMPSGLCPIYFPNTQAGSASMIDWISHIPPEKQSRAIICSTLLPGFMRYSQSPGVTTGSWSDAPVTSMLRKDGTQVKNKKCLTYPYNFLYVTNFQGKSAEYRYEFFANKTACTFDFYGRTTPNPVMIAVPHGYKMDLPQSSISNLNYDEMIELSGFPQIPWNVDAFKAWLAQSASSIAISALSFGEGLLMSLATGGAAGMPAMTNGAFGLASKAVEGVIASARPPQSYGGTSGMGKFSTGKLTLGFMNKHITPEYATIIDDYFNMYGYATKKVKVPNRNVRREWNFVKTVGCKVDGGFPSDVTQTIPIPSGGLPADDMRKIEQIYDNGITFWNDPLHVGNYNLTNDIPT